jgi:hypothetical protein
MERTTASRFDPRAVLALVGLAFVVATVWAAAALASGGSDQVSGSAGGSQSMFVQDSNGNGAAPSRDDCPDHGGSGGDTSPSDGSGSSGSDL